MAFTVKERDCRKCGETILEGQRRCKECVRRYNATRSRRTEHAAYMREWRRNNREKRRAQLLEQRYGLKPGDYEALFDAQAGVCAICKEPETARWMGTDRIRPLSVDHCHETGEVRGLLCHSCNRVLGLLNDDPRRLRDALEYLERTDR